VPVNHFKSSVGAFFVPRGDTSTRCNHRYEASVESYHPEERTHTLKYVDDNSTETLKLGLQRVMVLHSESLVNKYVQIYSQEDNMWRDPVKVVYYDSDRRSHVILDSNGDVDTLMLEWYAIRVQ
jgi:hypothetical protein